MQRREAREPPNAVPKPLNAIREPPNAIREPPNAVPEPPNAVPEPPNAVPEPPNAIREPRNAIPEPPNAIREPPNAIAEPRNVSREPRNESSEDRARMPHLRPAQSEEPALDAAAFRELVSKQACVVGGDAVMCRRCWRVRAQDPHSLEARAGPSAVVIGPIGSRSAARSHRTV